MSKFLINKNVLVRTVLLRNDTYRLNEGITNVNKGDISGCVATDLYIEKLNEIKSTIRLYSELARKDIDDVDRFIAKTMILDDAIAGVFK